MPDTVISLGLLSLPPEAMRRIAGDEASAGPSGTRFERGMALGVLSLTAMAALLVALL